MYSHFLVYLSVVASPSVFDTHALILSQLNVHSLTRENAAHKHKQTGHTVHDTILKVCVLFFVVHTANIYLIVYQVYLCVCVCVRARAAADNLISPV